MQHLQPQQKQLESQKNKNTALFARRTWLISFGTFIIALPLIAVVFFLSRFPFQLFFHDLSRIPEAIAAILLLFFLCPLLFALSTNRAYTIKAYQKAVEKYLVPSIKKYYPPEAYQAVQEHLTNVMSTNDLSQEQERHLLVLGGPGSGKTENLKYAVYQAVTSDRHKKNKVPVLIQMKYYNGFLRNSLVTSTTPLTDPTETLLAYLLDDKQEQKLQASKEPELVGSKRLRPYLRQLVREGRIVFLCDGMNELETDALQIIHRELTHLMQTQNCVVMTCRELEYQEQTPIQSLANNGTVIKTLPPLSEKDILGIVQSYLQSRPKRGQASLNDAEIEETQIQIRRLNQPHQNTSPFMLIMLIEALKNPETLIQTLSRGRLLQISVDQRLVDQQDAQEVKRFLSAIACTARSNGQRNALQLVTDRKFTSASQLHDFLNVWLADNNVDVRNYTQENIRKFLKIALDAGLITLSNYGVLSFMHELIAEYFAAEYLRFVYRRKDPEDDFFWQSFYDSETQAAGLWSEPVAVWAGLEDRPKEIARFLMTEVDHYCRGMNVAQADIYHYHALALSLACLGVRASEGLPDETLTYLQQSVRGRERREQLVAIFKRCADEGGIEVYQALLPYIHTPGLPYIFLGLHNLHGGSGNSTISTLLFHYLEEVATQPAYAPQTEALVATLGELGRTKGDKTVRPYAQELSEATKPAPLRSSAINILELLRNSDDVPRLINYLYDSNQPVVEAAINALITSGPEFTLDKLRQEEMKLRKQGYSQTRLNVLCVLGTYEKLIVLTSGLRTSDVHQPFSERRRALKLSFHHFHGLCG